MMLSGPHTHAELNTQRLKVSRFLLQAFRQQKPPVKARFCSEEQTGDDEASTQESVGNQMSGWANAHMEQCPSKPETSGLPQARWSGLFVLVSRFLCPLAQMRTGLELTKQCCMLFHTKRRSGFLTYSQDLLKAFRRDFQSQNGLWLKISFCPPMEGR